MIGFVGYWLNLDDSQERFLCMDSQLKRLGINSAYTRIPGVVGCAEEAVRYGLKPGEWGAWQGWLRLLRAAASSNAPIIHLLEDDVEISPVFSDFLQWHELKASLEAGKFVCTDGYVSPRQALQILSLESDAGSTSPWRIIHSGLAVPCINSLFLTPVVASILLEKLSNMRLNSLRLLPIDAAIASLGVRWVTVAPFVTGPWLDLSSDSATRVPSEAKSELSRFGLTLLRQMLIVEGDSHEARQGVARFIQMLADCGVIRPY